MSDPLSRSTQKTDQGNNKTNNKAKEFEKALQEEEKKLTQEKVLSFPQTQTQSTVITTFQPPSPRPQQQQQYQQQQQQQQQQQSMFGQILDAPRKLFFRTAAPPVQPQNQRQQSEPNEDFQIPVQQAQVHRDIKQLNLINPLLGEVAIQEAKTICFSGFQYYQGTLAATNYQLVFLPDKTLKSQRKDFFYIPYTFLLKVERVIEKKQNDTNYIDVQSKDGRTFKFKFPREQLDESFSLYNAIHRYAFNLNKNNLFAFQYFKEQKELEDLHQGWKIYNIEKDFDRMKLQISSENSPSLSLFKYISNENGVICPTYPNILVVPFKADQDCIVKTAKFRSKERIPILSYAFNLQNKVVSLWRSSQCKVGLGQNRSAEDEFYLKYMSFQYVDENENYDDKEIKLRIYDARPHINALGQQVTGKGYENTVYYRRCTIDFLDIHNIHKVRDAHLKLQKAAVSESTQFLSQLESSGWYDHIISIVQGASKVASTLVKEKINVLVHCSDGWDRTAQLVALTQIMIDPYYRTIEGLMVLIQKEWVFAGHQFCQRSGIGNRQHNDDQRSPIFLQFLDCIYQLMELYPLNFEFNRKLLQELAYHHLSSIFGTFICDSYLEIQKQKIMENTISIWSWILENAEKYQNVFYKSAHELDQEVLIPEAFSGKSVTFWKEYFTYYSAESFDLYEIFPNATFTSDNIQEMFKDIKKENQVLRQAQNDQEKLTTIQQQKIKQLMQIIQESKDETLLQKLEQINLN